MGGGFLAICLSNACNCPSSQASEKINGDLMLCSLHGTQMDPPPNYSSFSATVSSSASDVSHLAHIKQFGVCLSQKQYSIKASCRTVISNSLSVCWTLFCTMSDKWLLSTNQSAFMDKIHTLNFYRFIVVTNTYVS